VPKPLQLIEDAIKEAKSKGIKITRGAQFNWCGGQNGMPSACDAIGAVLIKNGKAAPGFYKGWLWEMCQSLGTDTYWFWRFTMGWNYHQRIDLLLPDPKKKDKLMRVKDEVSRQGDDLAKRYT
jgi:hypothetical protein